jgi:hypothetical protein
MNTGRKFIVSILFALTLASESQVNFEWARNVGSAGCGEHGYSTTVDANGNVYTTGSFVGTADFDPGPGVYTLTSVGSDVDVFVLKLDPNGNFVWAKQIGGGKEYGHSIALDALGNVHITGVFGAGMPVDFDPGPSTFTLTTSTWDIFVLKLDINGNFVWAKQMGGNGSNGDYGLSIATDAAGNVYTTGYFNTTADFDPGSGTCNLTTVGGFYDSDIFVSKLDAFGNFVWAKSFGSIYADYGQSITVDPSGNVYTTGFFGGTADFDPGAGIYTLPGSPSLDVFVSKLNSSGNFVWAKQLGGNGDDIGNGIAVDASGNIYTTGSFSTTADFDPGSGISNMTSSGDKDIFVSKLDASGSFLWVRQLGSLNEDVGNSIALDLNANVYTTGHFMGTAVDPVNNYTLSAKSNKEDIFISKLDASGNFVWAKNMGAVTSQTCASTYYSGECIAVDGSSNVYTSGYFYDTVDFDPNSGTYNLTTAGLDDIFIHKMSQPPLKVKGVFENDNMISIFPNPGHGIFQLTLPDHIKDGEVILVNSIGQEVYRQIVGFPGNTIKTDLTQGLYNCILFQDKKPIAATKIVVE